MKNINIEVEIFTRMVMGVGPRILSHSPQDYIRFKITLSSKKLELTLWKVPPTSARCRHDGREKQRTWKGRKRGGKQWKWRKMRKKKSKKNNIWRKEKKKKNIKMRLCLYFQTGRAWLQLPLVVHHPLPTHINMSMKAHRARVKLKVITALIYRRQISCVQCLTCCDTV